MGDHQIYLGGVLVFRKLIGTNSVVFEGFFNDFNELYWGY
jgi:hypothetical protein